jgi:class 3 adenylate cyclase
VKETIQADHLKATTCSAKYVFLDVVSFTKGRNVEAQTDIVDKLNTIILTCIDSQKVTTDNRIFIPTGDGVCIALINTEGKYDYDIHVQIALDILELLTKSNADQSDEMRRFEVRFGINANVDNLVTDINKNRNLAGDGISKASRIMDKADGSQILVGRPVFETLNQREQYMNRFAKHDAFDKHGQAFSVYQYIDRSRPGLNSDIPKAFVKELQKESSLKIGRKLAYYFAHAIKNRESLVRIVKEFPPRLETAQVLLWMLAQDSDLFARASDIRHSVRITYGSDETTFDEQFNHYRLQDSGVVQSFATELSLMTLRAYEDYFERDADSLYKLFVNHLGRRALKEEWPDIWNELDLDNYPLLEGYVSKSFRDAY